MADGHHFNLSPEIGVRNIGEEIFILAPTGDLVILKPDSGTFLWSQIEQGVGTEADLTRRLQEAFDVHEDMAAEDVNRFIKRLQTLGIIR